MKAYTVYQPYAYATVAGLKHYETRPRRTSIRGRVAVHAGKAELNYDRLYPYVKKGKKEKYLAAAQAAGKSLNEWIETTLDAAAQQTNGE